LVNILQFYVYWTVHHCDSWRIKDHQLDVTVFTEKANSFWSKTQEKKTPYFEWLLTPSPHIPHERTSCASACWTDTTPTQPHRNSNTHRTKNNTTNVVIQQNSRELLMMDILMSETCRTHKKWNKIASHIKLVLYSSTILQFSFSLSYTWPKILLYTFLSKINICWD